VFAPRLALASISGEGDAAWARRAREYAGCAFIGGVALDGPTRAAAREMVDRDREEFLPSDPVAFVERELAATDDLDLRAGVNVRATTLGPIREIASACVDHDAIIEINAHCRQAEMCAVGAGETLSSAPGKLAEQVRAASQAGATTSVKVRAEIDGVDLPAVARTVERAGGDAIHVDAMDSEAVVASVADAADLFVIANNGVRDRATAQEYLRYGADAVSVGRPSGNPAVLARVRRAVDDWFRGVDT